MHSLVDTILRCVCVCAGADMLELTVGDLGGVLGFARPVVCFSKRQALVFFSFFFPFPMNILLALIQNYKPSFKQALWDVMHGRTPSSPIQLSLSPKKYVVFFF